MLYLKRNLPTGERLARLLLAIACGLAALYTRQGFPAWLPIALALSAVSLAATALVGFCPACAMIGRKPQH